MSEKKIYEQAINRLKSSVLLSFHEEDDPDQVSWTGQIGILLTQNEANAILEEHKNREAPHTGDGETDAVDILEFIFDCGFTIGHDAGVAFWWDDANEKAYTHKEVIKLFTSQKGK